VEILTDSTGSGSKGKTQPGNGENESPIQMHLSTLARDPRVLAGAEPKAFLLFMRSLWSCAKRLFHDEKAAWKLLLPSRTTGEPL
jgi:hypothetical protein